MNTSEFLSYHLLSLGDFTIQVYHLLLIGLLWLATKLLLLIINRLIKRRIQHKKFDPGRGAGLYQIIKYFLITTAVLIGLQIVGVHITVLLAGSAALLVGLGLGIQQVFNDIVSGIILLFEASITPGDIVELDTMIGRVLKINVRTSEIETRENITVIVPNSKLVNDAVINWSHNRGLTRFNVKVGVAYGSNVALVKKLLIEAALENKDVTHEPSPIPRFLDFGNSSLDFEILFWSKKMFEIEQIRSDIRTAIDAKFRENNITIPFPQRDLHVKSGLSDVLK